MKEPLWLKNMRKESLKEFKSLPKPILRYGISLFTSIKDLDYEKIKAKKSKAEAKGKFVKTIHEALEDNSDLLKDYLMSRAYFTNQDKITSFHGAYWNDGFFIHIPKDTKVEEPITIDFSMEDFSATHVLVIAEPNSSVTILEKHSGEKGYKSHGVEIFAMEDSEVNYETVHDLGDVWNFNTSRAIVGKKASVNWLTFLFGGKLSKIEVSSDLVGKDASSENLGIFLGKGDQRFDIYNSNIHSASETSSNMDCKGLLLDNSTSTTRGLINIKESARGCDGYQKQDTILLSEEAEANVVPNLEINNNDVTCSHGATVSKVNEEHIFYLMSRGISRKQAELEISKGFLGETIRKSRSKALLFKKVEEFL